MVFDVCLFQLDLSGRVSRPRMRAISAERCAGVKTSAMGQESLESAAGR